ncbi:helix-turn-helix domain-containing protein [Zavarzinia sp.]|uniref:helix-turn-helix domain-containing protein n=1 Tax=Zavarzinia sp. TaxID=2027920 RepID=UPI00356AC804
MQLTPTERIAAYERETRERVVADAERRLPDRLYLSIGEVAAVLSVSEKTVIRMIKSGSLCEARINGGRRLPRGDVLEFIRRSLRPARFRG